jgi:hypothetical protein
MYHIPTLFDRIQSPISGTLLECRFKDFPAPLDTFQGIHRADASIDGTFTTIAIVGFQQLVVAPQRIVPQPTEMVDEGSSHMMSTQQRLHPFPVGVDGLSR